MDFFEKKTGIVFEKTSAPPSWLTKCRGLDAMLIEIPERPATKKELLLQYSPSCVDEMEQRFSSSSSSEEDSSKVIRYNSDLVLAGSCLDLLTAISNKQVGNGVAVIRVADNGGVHHIFNMAALSTSYARSVLGYQRVLVVELESQGSEGCNVLIHQLDDLPLTSAVPADLLAVWHNLLLPFATELGPDFTLVSLKGAGWQPAVVSHLLWPLARTGPLCVLLQLESGGPEELVVVQVLSALQGLACPSLGPLPTPHPSTRTAILDVISRHCEQWKSLRIHPTFQGEEWTQADLPVGSDLQQEIEVKIQDNRTCLVYNPEMTTHMQTVDMEGNLLKLRLHCEVPARISTIYHTLAKNDLLPSLYLLHGRPATEEELALVHSKDYIEEMQSVERADGPHWAKLQHKYYLNYFCKDTYRSAALAAGSLIQVVETVLSGKCQNGVAVIRPPGHHAEPDCGSGGCHFNNVAVAAHYALANFSLDRILIVDWDIHHGNGTQKIFYEDSRVVYISLHRYEDGSYFPHLKEGNVDATGNGYNINIPWNGVLQSTKGDGDYLSAFCHVILPVAYQFDPQLVLISAGFDSAFGDPVGRCAITPGGYHQMTSLLGTLAEGKVILVLEGGYNLKATAASATECVRAQLGLHPQKCLEPGLAPTIGARETICSVMAAHRKFWPSLALLEGLSPRNYESEVEDRSLAGILPTRKDCSHLDLVKPLPLVLLEPRSCSECQTSSASPLEWCLSCHKYYCGIYGENHSKQHSMQSGHPLFLTDGHDGVFTCFACGAAIVDNPALEAIKQDYLQLK